MFERVTEVVTSKEKGETYSVEYLVICGVKVGYIDRFNRLHPFKK